ncbi:hypothetical protein ACFRJ9_08330 [Paenarthrobacter sp. NPDC056912]|uniref:hypothetical protein n=1 Tax=Paenarthrobacter sp. NPDC056912 TaxID=3345965 RepID=UPI003670F220
MSRTRWLSYALVGVSSAAVAVVAVLGATALAAPASLSPPGEAMSAAVTMTGYRDERTVAGEIEASEPVEATLGLSGTVTSSACTAGGEIKSGHVVASLSGRPVLGLHSAVPFYRDIGPGTAGADVDAFRAQLKATGLDVAEKGAYGADLRAAILKIQTDLALKNHDAVLHHEETLWLPADSVRVKSCNALLGSQYAPGSPFITIVGSVSSLRVVYPPGQPPAPGARLVSFGNVSAPVSADGMVTDPTLLGEISRSPDFAATQSSNSPKPLSIKTSLASPLEVAKVPVSGVFGAHQSTACVKSAEGTIIPITIAGSSAGSVLATFEKEVPKEILLGEAIGARECP